MLQTFEARLANALLNHVSQLAFTPSIPVAFPGVSFAPPAGTYLEVTLLTNLNVNRGVSNDSTTEHRGILQITVASPSNGGIIAPMGIAGKVVAHFERGTVIYSNDVSLRIEGRPSVAQPLQEADRLRIPVTIPYYAFN